MESGVKERLVCYLKHRGISKSEFGRRIGASSAFVSSIRASIGDDKLKAIALNFPELNQEWLLYGFGEMIKAAPGSIVNIQSSGHDSVFRSGEGGEGGEAMTLRREVEHLRALLEEKERTIGILMRMLDGQENK